MISLAIVTTNTYFVWPKPLPLPGEEKGELEPKVAEPPKVGGPPNVCVPPKGDWPKNELLNFAGEPNPLGDSTGIELVWKFVVAELVLLVGEVNRPWLWLEKLEWDQIEEFNTGEAKIDSVVVVFDLKIEGAVLVK